MTDKEREEFEKEVEAFTLPEKKVKVKMNDKNPGWVKRPNHAAYFLVEGAYQGYTTAMLRNGTITNPFTKVEKEALTRILGFSDNELNVYNKQGMLYTINVRLGKDGITLDLSDPMDYIRYKVLLTNKDKIAPSYATRGHKSTYKFYIEDQDDIAKEAKLKISSSTEAWKEFGKMSNDRKEMMNFLKAYGLVKSNVVKPIAKNVKTDFLETQISELIEKDIKGFLEIRKFEKFDTLVLLANSIENKNIIREKNNFSLADGTKIGSTLSEAIAHLSAAGNQDLVLILQEKNK